MKRLMLVLIAATTLFSSCSSSKKSSGGTATSIGKFKGFPPSTPRDTDDALSFETAIVITETSETTGVSAEYVWIKKHYPGYTMGSQSLVMSNNKPFDILNITTADGNKLKLYFDISNFYGKF